VPEMKQTRLIMNMPITVEIVDPRARRRHFDRVFDLFKEIEGRFSPFSETSETTLIDRGLLRPRDCSPQMRVILQLAEETRRETWGYFDVRGSGRFNPVGIVKGWAIHKAARQLRREGFRDFFVDAGGDIELSGKNADGKDWLIGIRNPFAFGEVIKVLELSSRGVATSGTYVRGDHLYDPLQGGAAPDSGVVSITVIGPNAYEADRFATAALAMGRAGIDFIEQRQGLEAYMVDQDRKAIYTSGFDDYVAKSGIVL
jgi:FAD:protein FMN transferase